MVTQDKLFIEVDISDEMDKMGLNYDHTSDHDANLSDCLYWFLDNPNDLNVPMAYI